MSLLQKNGSPIQGSVSPLDGGLTFLTVWADALCGLGAKDRGITLCKCSGAGAHGRHVSHPGEHFDPGRADRARSLSEATMARRPYIYIYIYIYINTRPTLTRLRMQEPKGGVSLIQGSIEIPDGQLGRELSLKPVARSLSEGNGAELREMDPEVISGTGSW